MNSAAILAELLEASTDGTLAGVRVALPGRIESYDAATRRATVQILIADGHIDEAAERKTTTIAPLTDVPVLMHGSGDVRVKIPIRKGDPCWIMFASSSIARWKASGGLVDPGDDRHHHEADAVVMPIPRVVGNVEDEAMIEFTDDGLIRAGGNEPLVTKSEFDAHTHPAPGGATSAPTTPATGTARLRG